MRQLLLAVLFAVTTPTSTWGTNPEKGATENNAQSDAPPKAPPLGTSRRAWVTQVIQPADTIVFRSGEFSELVFRIKAPKDKEVITAFGGVMLFDQDAFDGRYSFCLCVDEQPKQIRFQHGDKVVAQFWAKHDGFYSTESWLGHPNLTIEGKQRLQAWFDRIGYSWETFRLHRLEWEKARAEQELQLVPAEARAVIRLNEDISRIPDRIAFAVGSSRLIGRYASRYWDVRSGRLRPHQRENAHLYQAAHAIRSISGEEFVSALERIAADPEAMLGAAHLFFVEEVWKRIPEDVRGTWAVKLGDTLLRSVKDSPEALEERAALVIPLLPLMRSPEVVSYLGQLVQRGPGLTHPPSRKLLHPHLSALLALARLGEGVTAEEVQLRLNSYQCMEDPQLPDEEISEFEYDSREERCQLDTEALQLAAVLLSQKTAEATDLNLRDPSIHHAFLDLVERSPTQGAIDELADELTSSWKALSGDEERPLRTFEKVTGWNPPRASDWRKAAQEAKRWWEEHRLKFPAQNR